MITFTIPPGPGEAWTTEAAESLIGQQVTAKGVANTDHVAGIVTAASVRDDGYLLIEMDENTMTSGHLKAKWVDGYSVPGDG